MIGFVSLAFALLALVAQQGRVTAAGSDDLANAKLLYASGAYEEALTRLAAARTDTTADEVDEYSALCLLALGRTGDADHALEQLVTRTPMFTMSEVDMSPRVVAMLHAVRRRVLPVLARDLYAKSKAHFEQGQLGIAAAGFREVLEIIDDPDAVDDGGTLSDIKLVADGFLKLAENQLAAATPVKAPPAAAAPPPVSPVSPASPSPPAEKIYSDGDAGVTAPVAIAQVFPPWQPPTDTVAHQQFRGVLTIVVDTKGMVESAVITQSIVSAYDPLLIEAAHRWRFRPALLAGTPVKFRHAITVVLSGAGL